MINLSQDARYYGKTLSFSKTFLLHIILSIVTKHFWKKIYLTIYCPYRFSSFYFFERQHTLLISHSEAEYHSEYFDLK